MFWKILLVLGILGILLGFIVAAVCAALPSLTDGRASFDETVWGIVAGMVFAGFSFFVFLIGLIFVIINRRKNKSVVSG
ncbi:MAG TPA: hypothetical protein VJV05_15775 [Pyrinomonadaceae bacterium]|nr:hypothetical protein [Pyrinomonadaceae bacterium]